MFHWELDIRAAEANRNLDALIRDGQLRPDAHPCLSCQMESQDPDGFLRHYEVDRDGFKVALSAEADRREARGRWGGICSTQSVKLAGSSEVSLGLTGTCSFSLVFR